MTITLTHMDTCKCGCGTAVRRTWAQGHNPKANERLRVSYVIEDRGYGTPCWIWQGVPSAQGYGRRWFGGRQTTAHRAYYEEMVGPVPGGKVLDHLCEQKLCVNPDHMLPCSIGENVRRTASRVGGTNGRIKVTTDDLVTIREMRAAGASQSQIGRRFGVSQAHVSKLLRLS